MISSGLKTPPRFLRLQELVNVIVRFAMIKKKKKYNAFNDFSLQYRCFKKFYFNS